MTQFAGTFLYKTIPKIRETKNTVEPTKQAVVKGEVAGTPEQLNCSPAGVFKNFTYKIPKLDHAKMVPTTSK